MSDYKYFSPETDPLLFTCSETGETGISPAFVTRLDILRGRCGFPFIITSGYRSRLHSKERDKKDGPGEHNRGAADVKATSSHRRYVILREAMAMGFKGIGVGEDFIHVDDRIGLPVTWSYY